MTRFLSALLKLLCVPALVTALAVTLTAFLGYHLKMHPAVFLHPCFMAMGAGLGGRLLLNRLCQALQLSNPMAFADTLEHELTHALFGYLTFSPPLSLLATLESGGEVRLKRQNILVVLSPYFFPLWCCLALGVGFFVKESYAQYWNLVPHVLYGNFLYRLGTELRWYQNDFQVYGRIFSMALSFFMCLLFFFFLLRVTLDLDWQWVHLIPTQLVELSRRFGIAHGQWGMEYR